MMTPSRPHPLATATATLALVATTLGCATAAPSRAQELKVYKERVAVTAKVQCGGYERFILTCTADVTPLIEKKLAPEMILRYTGISLQGKEIEVHASPTNEPLRFPAGGVNYSGTQKLQLDVIYLK